MTTFALLLLALQDPAFETSTLDPGPRADKLVARDLDGDGRMDLLVQGGRDIHVYLFDKARGFTPAPQQSLRLDGGTFLWTFGKLDGRDAIFAAGSRGVLGYAFEGGAFGPARELVVHPSIFEGACAEARPPAYVDFAPDLDGDGRSDLLLFQKDAVLLLKQHEGGEFRCLQRLAIAPDVATLFPWAPGMRLLASVTVPALSFGDVNGDGRLDIGTYRDESIGFFIQGADGRFTDGEAHDLAGRRKKRDRFFKFELPPYVADFNKDGLLDLVVCFPSKGRVQISYGAQGRSDLSQPDDLIQITNGWTTGLYTEDLDGDGKIDLIMGVLRKFGIMEGIQMFLSGKLDVELHVYPMLAAGRFTKDPVQELKFSIPYSVQVSRTSASVDVTFKPNFQGDFNKDGRKDMLSIADPATLIIHPGVAGRMIADQPSGTIKMNPPEGTLTTEPFVADFNGDGVSDLVLKHVLVGGRKKHVLELKLSR